jgi:hypothetical protein
VVVMPRYSFVRVALAPIASVAAILRVTLSAWWSRALPAGRTGRDPRRRTSADLTGRKPQPISAFPELHRLIVHEPRFTDPAVRAQRLWEKMGCDGAQYAYFLVSEASGRTLGLLMRDFDPAYMRSFTSLVLAAIDSAFWAREILEQPVRRVFELGGIDERRHCTWSVVIVQRLRRYELQITSGSLIPWARDFKTLEEAIDRAESWLTDFHHRDGESRPTPPSIGGMLGGFSRRQA